METIIAIVSDTHVGSTVGLCPPKFTIHTGRKNEVQQATSNAVQKWLYAGWLEFWQYVEQQRQGKRLVVIHAGDIVDGKHHNSPQVMDEPGDQIEAACNLLRPIVARADAFFLTYGTEAHAGNAAYNEIVIGNELGINHDWEYYLDIDGVTLDIAHHGRAGRRDWTSSAAGMAAEVALDYAADCLKPPRYVVRGHNHMVDDSGQKLPYTRAIGLPCWQLRTSFGYRVAANRKHSDIGGLLIDTAHPDSPDFSRLRYEAPKGRRKAVTV